MYIVKENKSFRKSLKRFLYSGKFKRDDVQTVIEILASGEKLNSKYKDHELKGYFCGIKECHIAYDLLLLYKIDETDLILLNIGSHSDLFE